MKKICLASLLMSCLLLVSCSVNKSTKSISIIDDKFIEIYENLNENIDDNQDLFLYSQLDELTELYSKKDISDITIYSDNISDNDAKTIISEFKNENIPIIFILSKIDNNILSEYDKAYNITINYEYVGEKFAEIINQMWINGDIVDKDLDMIFSYNILKTESVSSSNAIFAESLLRNIELLGVPLKHNNTITFSSEDEIKEYFNEPNTEDGIIIISQDILDYFLLNKQEDTNITDIFAINYIKNNDAIMVKDNIKICNIVYSDFIQIKNIILDNINNIEYPFKGIDNGVVGKTVYVTPQI